MPGTLSPVRRGRHVLGAGRDRKAEAGILETDSAAGHHYLAALEFARPAGQETAPLAEHARIALSDAGDRALALEAFSAAARFYEQALELWPPDDPERPLLLFSYGRVLFARNQGFDVLSEARDGLLAAGEVEKAADAETMLGNVLRFTGQRAAADEHFKRAAALVEGKKASPSITFVLWHLSRARMMAGEDEMAIELGERALAIAEELGIEPLRAGALTSIGSVRLHRGDLEGVHDLERPIEVAEAARLAEAFRAYGNLGSFMFGVAT